MARRRGQAGRSIVRLFVWLFALVGAAGTFFVLYQYRKLAALYSFVDVASTSDKVDMSISFDAERLAEKGLAPDEAVKAVEGALDELGIRADVTGSER